MRSVRPRAGALAGGLTRASGRLEDFGSIAAAAGDPSRGCRVFSLLPFQAASRQVVVRTPQAVRSAVADGRLADRDFAQDLANSRRNSSKLFEHNTAHRKTPRLKAPAPESLRLLAEADRAARDLFTGCSRSGSLRTRRALGEDGMSLVQLEAAFPTGDRIDVVLRDRFGRLVAVEVEGICDETEIAGPLQCAKYRALLSYAFDRPHREAILAAPAIDRAIVSRCEMHGIEARLVSIPQPSPPRA